MACKMVDWLNGSIEWLFKRSTICLFGDKIKMKTFHGLRFRQEKVLPL
jgi:hypothetical protein